MLTCALHTIVSSQGWIGVQWRDATIYVRGPIPLGPLPPRNPKSKGSGARPHPSIGGQIYFPLSCFQNSLSFYLPWKKSTLQIKGIISIVIILLLKSLESAPDYSCAFLGLEYKAFESHPHWAEQKGKNCIFRPHPQLRPGSCWPWRLATWAELRRLLLGPMPCAPPPLAVPSSPAACSEAPGWPVRRAMERRRPHPPPSGGLSLPPQ